MSIDWGDAPTWVAAFFAAGAAAFAGGTLRSQRQQIAEQRRFIAEQSANLALEREALAAAAAMRRAEQARLVRVEELFSDPVVWNESGAPITNVSCRTGEFESQLGNLADSEQAVFNHHLALQESTPVETPVSELRPGKFVAFAGHEEGRDFTIFFTDDAGNRWSLNQDNVLRSASDA